MCDLICKVVKPVFTWGMVSLENFMLEGVKIILIINHNDNNNLIISGCPSCVILTIDLPVSGSGILQVHNKL